MLKGGICFYIIKYFTLERVYMFSFQTIMFTLLASQKTAHQFIVFHKINAFKEMI